MNTRALWILSLVIFALTVHESLSQCTAEITATNTAPGIYLFRAVGRGACPPNRGTIRMYIDYWTGLRDCVAEPTEPCVAEWSSAVVCTPTDFEVEVKCEWGSSCGEAEWATARIHVESEHQPSISPKDINYYATVDPPYSGDLNATFHIVAPAAWSDRVVTYAWLPDGIAAGSDQIPFGEGPEFDRSRGIGIPTGQKFLAATIRSCGDKSATAIAAAHDNACCCQATPTAPPCVGQPISVSSGNMRMTDSDPLPGMPLLRTYDSTSSIASERFGSGWRSLFDPILRSTPLNGDTYVTVETAEAAAYVFRSSGGGFTQVWPQNGPPAVLAYNGADGTYTLHEPQHDVDVVARASDGVPLKYHSRSTGRDVIISYAGSLPTSVADSWGAWSWTLTTDGATGCITAISVDGTGLTWTYNV